jgi:hypothetical protein
VAVNEGVHWKVKAVWSRSQIKDHPTFLFHQEGGEEAFDEANVIWYQDHANEKIHEEEKEDTDM